MYFIVFYPRTPRLGILGTASPLASTHWANKDFHKDVRERQPAIERVAQSWREQFDWGITAPLAALPEASPPRMPTTRGISSFNFFKTYK